MTDPNCLGTVRKRLAERFDVAFILTNWVTTGDTIATATGKVYSGTTDMSSTMVGTVADDNAATVTVELLAAGTAGQTYTLIVTAITTNGDIWQPWVYLVVS